jgi:hypothetical protein
MGCTFRGRCPSPDCNEMILEIHIGEKTKRGRYHTLLIIRVLIMRISRKDFVACFARTLRSEGAFATNRIRVTMLCESGRDFAWEMCP